MAGTRTQVLAGRHHQAEPAPVAEAPLGPASRLLGGCGLSPSANTSSVRALAPQRAGFWPPTKCPELLGQQAQAGSLLGQARWSGSRVLTPTAEQVPRA